MARAGGLSRAGGGASAGWTLAPGWGGTAHGRAEKGAAGVGHATVPRAFGFPSMPDASVGPISPLLAFQFARSWAHPSHWVPY